MTQGRKLDDLTKSFTHHRERPEGEPPTELPRLNKAFIDGRVYDVPDHYEMLEYRGEWEVVTCGMVRPTYHYSCKNLKPIANGKFECGIYETRPTMCRTFPFCAVASDPMRLSEDQKGMLLQRYPYLSQYKGCTFNIDDQDPANKTREEYYAVRVQEAA